MARVAAVVVTYNRRDLVTVCLRRLVEQSRSLDRIYLIDNASTDDTHQALVEQGLIDRVDYVRLDRNTGGAGGFHEGMRRAYDAGFDWIWIMDDDGEPLPDALERMEPWFNKPGIAAVLPMISDEGGALNLSEPHRGYLLDRSSITGEHLGRSITAEEIGNQAAVDINYFSFVGPCFPRSTIERCGLPLAKFFIHYDDIEYSRRVSQVGRVVMVTGAKIINHAAYIAEGGDAPTAGRRTFPYKRLWLRYFGYRNRVWLITHGKIDAPKLPLFIAHARLLARTLMFDDNKLRRLIFWNSAFLSGLTGNFNNDRARRILYGLDG